MTKSSNMFDLFTAARRTSVPLVVVQSADQASAQAELVEGSAEFPLIQWDAASGMFGLNDKGKDALSKAGVKQQDTIGFVEAMIAAQQLPRGSVVFGHNVHRQLQSQEPLATATNVQAVANLRETFKKNFRMFVMLCGVGASVPSELDQDVMVLSQPLPGHDALGTIVKELYVSAKLPAPKADLVEKAVDAVSGLSGFAAEQAISVSFTEDGVDLQALWERKRTMIEQTPGLSVWRGGEKFDDLVGLDGIKAKLRSRMQSRTPIGCVLFIDEIDKVLANVESDTSGVRTDQMRTLLTEMENNEWRGLVAVGVAGGGKSAIAKAFGNEVGVPTVALDLGGMESKYVGESEQRLRTGMHIVKAIGRGNAYVIATSNNASVMRPELQRRFTDGMWFFDLMSDAERTAALRHYIRRYELTKAQVAKVPDIAGWTGAEIRNMCRDAWDTGCTLTEAARFIVPMSRSRADEIEKLRRYAHSRFLDAAKMGDYQYVPAPMEAQLRAIALPKSTAGMKES